MWSLQRQLDDGKIVLNLEMEQEYTFGSSREESQYHVTLADDATISEKHLKFVAKYSSTENLSKPILKAMDLGSKNGTYVNYGSIGPHVWIDLEEGSVILLGRRRNIIVVRWHDDFADVSVSETNRKSNWSADFENLFTSQTGSDVCFIIAGQEIKAHKIILSARSPVFAAMFNSDMKEKSMDRIDIKDIDPDIFNALLRFIYTDRVELTETNVGALLAVANQYLLPFLKSNCEKFIVHRLSTENCVEMLTLADLHNAMQLKRMATKYFRSRQAIVRKTEGWKNLKKSRLDVACDIMENLLDLT